MFVKVSGIYQKKHGAARFWMLAPLIYSYTTKINFILSIDV